MPHQHGSWQPPLFDNKSSTKACAASGESIGRGVHVGATDVTRGMGDWTKKGVWVDGSVTITQGVADANTVLLGIWLAGNERESVSGRGLQLENSSTQDTSA